MVGSATTPPQVRFGRFVRKDASGCWEWTGGLFKHFPYGKFNAGRLPGGKQRTVYAHRFAYELWVGAIPKGLQVLHRCDNPACVNPAHLFVGTQLDNMRDMIAKGRNNNGGWQTKHRSAAHG